MIGDCSRSVDSRPGTQQDTHQRAVLSTVDSRPGAQQDTHQRAVLSMQGCALLTHMSKIPFYM